MKKQPKKAAPNTPPTWGEILDKMPGGKKVFAGKTFHRLSNIPMSKAQAMYEAGRLKESPRHLARIVTFTVKGEQYAAVYWRLDS